MRERKREILKRVAKKRSSKAIASLIGASLIAGALSRNRRKKEERKRYLEAIGEVFSFGQGVMPGTPTKRRKGGFGGDTAPGMPGKPAKKPPGGFGGNPVGGGGLPGTPVPPGGGGGGFGGGGLPGDPVGTNKLPKADPFAPDPPAPPKRPEKPPEEPREPSEQEKKRQEDLAGKSRDYMDLKTQKRELAGKVAKLESLNPDRHGKKAYPDFLPGDTEEEYKKTLEEAEDLYEQLKGAGEIDSEAEDVLEYIGGGALEIPEPELPPIEYVE
mgnify:CR=1 FL=1